MLGNRSGLINSKIAKLRDRLKRQQKRQQTQKTVKKTVSGSACM